MVVFAPHPDDETLGAGGLIRQAVRRGAQVEVVFLTSGDGFALCAAERYRRWPTASVRQRLACEREGEAAAALGCLGLSAGQITYLGCADRTLERLQRSGPASLAIQDRLSESLAGDVDYVVYPDAADDHPDHRATHHLVRKALASWCDGGDKRPVELTYLIHHGRWPWPFAAAPEEPLLPPAALRDAGRWEVLPLGPEDLAAKRDAIRAHRSQQRLMGYFLPAFIRANEVFRRL